MATVAAVGRSAASEGRAAGREATQAALTELGGDGPDVCLVFATAAYDHAELLAGVAETAGGAKISGCSGEGIIALADSLECDYAVAVMAIRSTAMNFEPFLVRDYDEEPARCGRDLARAVAECGDDAVGLLIFPDGLRGNCTEFLTALEAALPVPVIVAGGTSADNMAFTRTYQYCGTEPASNAISALLVRGRGRMEVAVSHGCAPIGLERNVTEADSGWIRRIDGEPAWDVFKEYLDGDPKDLNAEGIVHLCIGEPLAPELAAGYAPFVIRTPLALDSDSGALFFPGGGLHTGQRIQLTRRDPAQIRESAVECATTILDRREGHKPALVLQFDCAGRGKVLFGSRAAEEIVAPLMKAVGVDTPWLGFHTYGEIAPISSQAYYHNYTVVLCALYEVDE